LTEDKVFRLSCLVCSAVVGPTRMGIGLLMRQDGSALPLEVARDRDRQ